MAIYGALDTKTGKVDPRTVSDTHQGVMVNWLWLRGIKVMQHWPYSLIRTAFVANSYSVELAEIEIEVKRTMQPDLEAPAKS